MGELFWGDQMDFAIRGKNGRKAAAYARRVAAENGQNANDFLSGVHRNRLSMLCPV
jgi:hypothetical protein